MGSTAGLFRAGLRNAGYLERRQPAAAVSGVGWDPAGGLLVGEPSHKNDKIEAAELSVSQSSLRFEIPAEVKPIVFKIWLTRVACPAIVRKKQFSCF